MNKGEIPPAGFIPGARKAITGADAGIGHSIRILLVQDPLRAGEVILTRGESAPVRTSHV
ncbi:MAG TPA: hypothetical protein VNL74_00295 [Methylococcus sp.]|nr:hypothetical protein [Methylococcus sp.]